ncbi:HAD family phosphatase [Gemmobacter lutimaris]|uniref:HAD family phosphatase n=1 Tax=Gemmobacter lutimaris TaxID=2306023 RepID=A0A398C0B6_9RHOB|nr:HAD family phosphatase [Gemmobacter lutimaris]RID93013.1 HAD family phosphatase [Gemmobacter lutimaris]
MTTPQAVIFDIGNVLLEWNPERFYDWQIGRAQREALFAEVDLHAMNEAIDAGAPFRDTIYDLADRTPDWAEEIRMWHDNWLDMASPRIDGSVTLLRALRSRGVAVFALTNFGIGSFDYAKTRYDFLSEFDRAYVSGHLGVTKPDPRIYERVEADCGLPPGSLLFTDDREANIAVARARGWRCHLFEGWQGWARRLVAEGLLNEKEAGL